MNAHFINLLFFLLIVDSKFLQFKKNGKDESMLTVWGKAQQS